MTLVEKYGDTIYLGPCESSIIDDHAAAIVFILIDDLRSRSGDFDDMFVNIDDTTKEEILQTNVDAVKARMMNAMRVLG